MEGYFIVSENIEESFDIKCELRPNIEGEVPEIQSKLYSEVESTCNTIKALENTSEDIKRKYFNKLLSLAQVGLVPEKEAQPQMALLSLDKLKAEMLVIEGKRIKNSYMKNLGLLAASLGCIVSIAMAIIYWIFHIDLFAMIGYTWFGAMVGAWISFGARKFELKFEDLGCIEQDMLEPMIRLIYIGVSALIFELFLICDVISIKFGNITTDSIRSSGEIQMLVGVICGLVESKIGIDIYKRANSAIITQEDSLF